MFIFMLIFQLFFTPCVMEDSTNCTWYASTQGNHAGATFTDVNGATIYWEAN